MGGSLFLGAWNGGALSIDGNARDVEGNHSGALNGATPTSNLHGYSQKGLSFDGLDDNIEITESSRI